MPPAEPEGFALAAFPCRPGPRSFVGFRGLTVFARKAKHRAASDMDQQRFGADDIPFGWCEVRDPAGRRRVGMLEAEMLGEQLAIGLAREPSAREEHVACGNALCPARCAQPLTEGARKRRTLPERQCLRAGRRPGSPGVPALPRLLRPEAGMTPFPGRLLVCQIPAHREIARANPHRPRLGRPRHVSPASFNC